MARSRRSLRLTDVESSFDADRNEMKTARPATVNGRNDGPVDKLEDETFIVKSIRDHIVDKDGNPKYLVEWLGYEKKKDWTWEPENNLSIAGDQILNEYYATIGGRDKIFKKPGGNFTTKRARRVETNKNSPTSTTSTKQWSPPPGSWEEHIERIDHCEKEEDGKLTVYLVWRNGQRTKHGTRVIYEKCPQKMLKYYEKHIRIMRSENDAQRGETSAF